MDFAATHPKLTTNKECKETRLIASVDPPNPRPSGDARTSKIADAGVPANASLTLSPVAYGGKPASCARSLTSRLLRETLRRALAPLKKGGN